MGSAKPWCDVVAGAVPRGFLSEDRPSPQSGASAEVRIGDVFVECHDRYRQLFPSDQAAIDYAVLNWTGDAELEILIVSEGRVGVFTLDGTPIYETRDAESIQRRGVRSGGGDAV